MTGRVDLTFSVYRTLTRVLHPLSSSLAQPRAASVCALKHRGFVTDSDDGDRSSPNGWIEQGGRKRTDPQVNMSVTRGNILKMSVASTPGRGPTQFMYQNIDFSGLEARMQSVPRWMRWAPHFIRQRIYAVLLAQAKRRLLAEDFDENEFYHYAALVSVCTWQRQSMQVRGGWVVEGGKQPHIVNTMYVCLLCSLAHSYL